MAELSANERALHAELGEWRAEVAERGRFRNDLRALTGFLFATEQSSL